MKIDELADYIRSNRDIIFIIGAGASKSAGIPLAAELVAQNKKYGHCLKRLSAADKASYGKVMSALSPQERKDLIEPLLHNAKLNWGHVALASIIQKANVKRILSFNFDFLLERAVSLLGYHLPVYDFGVAPASNITGLADKALFHLHGQSYGLKLLNSDAETKKHAENLRPLIRDSLRNHMTIVAGYSGCADSAFQVMLKEYTGYSRLFWLGFDEEADPCLLPLLKKPYVEYIGGCDFDRSMIEIARGLQCWPLPILENPPKYIAQQLEPLPGFPVGEEDETAILQETRSRLKKMSVMWDDDRPVEEREASALMAGLPVGDRENISGASSEVKEMRGWRFFEIANKLRKEALTLKGNARSQKLKQACRKYANAVQINPDMAGAYNNWGNALSMVALTLEGDARAQKFNSAYEKYAAAVQIKPDMAGAYNNWANALKGEAKTLDGDARAQKLKQACEKYAKSAQISPDMAGAYSNWGLALRMVAETLDGDARAQKFQEAYKKYANSVRIKHDAAYAYSNWGSTLKSEAEALEGDARMQKLTEALEKIERAKKISGKADYNLACALALMGDPAAALDELEACRKDGTLPDKARVWNDADLTCLQDDSRFGALFES